MGIALLGLSTSIALRDRGFGTVPAETPAVASPVAAPSLPAKPARPAVPADPAAVRQDPRLAHLPETDLIEASEFGPLPVRAADGRRPFDVYSRGWSGTRGPRIAIVIGGLGISQTDTMYAIDLLPPEITFAFSPGGNSIRRWTIAARNKGHELLLQLPLEPSDYPRIDPGRGTLTVDVGGEERTRQLHWVLGRMTNYVGMVNHMGDRFVTTPEALAPVMAEIGARGLMYLDDGTEADSLAPALAAEQSTPFAASDAVIDLTPGREAILDNLDTLERIARARGTAIGTGSTAAITVATLRQWIVEARGRGIEIVPVSALARDPERPLQTGTPDR